MVAKFQQNPITLFTMPHYRYWQRMLACLFMYFFVLNEPASQQIHLAPFGDDLNPGTAEQPMATLTGARDRIRFLRKQDTTRRQHYEVIIRKGEYFMQEPLTLSVDDGGTESVPLVFRGEEGVVFYGGIYLSRFEKVTDHLWKVNVPEVKRYGWRFEQLYVNGVRATRAQTPNAGFYTPVSVNETVLVKGADRIPSLAVQQIRISGDAAASLKNAAQEELKEAVVTFYHHWDNTKKNIRFFDQDDTSIYIGGEGMPPWNPITAKSLFVIENLRSALDAPGEWFLDHSGTLFYYPRPGETIATTTAMAPAIDQFVTLTGNEKTGEKIKNVRFENIHFRVAGYRMPAGGVEPAQSAAPIPAVIELDFASNISFVNCEISATGSSGIWFRRACDNGLIEHCYLHDLGAGAVKIGETVWRDNPDEITHHIKVVNNIARGGGQVFPCAAGMIIFHGRDNELMHNDIADFKYTGISVGWVWGYTPSPSKRNRIEYNHIHHLGWGVLSDMGGVYTLGASEGTTVSHNVIHHIYSRDYGGWGLYTDEGSQGITMENNLVYNCKNAGFHQHYGKENIIRNNIFANHIKSELQATRVEDHLSFSFTQNIVYFSQGTLLSSNWTKVRMFTDKNCYWDTRGGLRFGNMTFSEWQGEGKDIHSVVTDPRFADPAKFDFRITNRKMIRKTGFKPFDYSRAGVFGTADWIKKAQLDPERVQAFNQLVHASEPGLSSNW